jgi:hypothetical protein
VYGRTSQALLLEHLGHSVEWRLANESDRDRQETGIAVAEWYRQFHEAGFKTLARQDGKPGFLKDWVSEIDAERLRYVGEKFNLGEVGLSLAVEHIERLKEAFQALPQTFNYNDFDLENLALSRQIHETLRAVVFDYDQVCLGPRYCDWRNVWHSLRGDARDSFVEAFGPVDDKTRSLDEPLSILYGLVIASRRAQLPGWARTHVEAVKNGELEDKINRVLLCFLR